MRESIRAAAANAESEVEFSLGFMETNPNFRFGNPGSFGMPGAGGSLGFADQSPNRVRIYTQPQERSTWRRAARRGD